MEKTSPSFWAVAPPDPVVAVVLATFPRQKRPAMLHRRLLRRNIPNFTTSERLEIDLGYRINVITLNHIEEIKRSLLLDKI